MSKRLRKDDRVVVISGNEKGKSGNVIKRLNDRVVIQGLNLRKKHVKRTQENQTAQIIEMEGSMHISNVSFCDDKGKAVKARVKRYEDGSSVLYYLKEGNEAVLRQIKRKKD